MSATSTSNPASVADRLQTYFSKKLLKVQVDETVMEQGAMMEDLPAKAGSRTIRFFKPSKADTGLNSAPTATDVVHALTEGTAISNFRENVWTKVDVTLKQYGAATKITDVLDMIDAYQPVKQNIELMGRDAALHYDTVIRNAIVGSTHPDGSTTPLTHGSNGTNGCELFITGSGGEISNSGTSSTHFSSLSTRTQAEAKATRLFVLGAATRLKVNKAPKLKGGYLCFLPPQVMHDLVRDSDYKDAFNGRGAEGVYKGSLGRIDGFQFIEHTNPFIEDETYGTYDSTDDNADGLIYSTIFTGAGAYGCVKLAGTRSPLKPQVFIHDKGEKVDPLNQYIIAGWKAYYMAMGLDSANIVVGRCKSTFA